jgi:SAM-dependent methyltransferase
MEWPTQSGGTGSSEVSGNREDHGPRRILLVGAGAREMSCRAGEIIVRVDRVADLSPDVVWDLENFPWPFQDDSFHEIICTDVLEHLSDIVRTMEEIHRVAKNQCIVAITTPHFSCSNSFTDPTHRQHLGFFSFDYFTGENQWGFYTRVRFRKSRALLVFDGALHNKVIRRIASRWPAFYERHLTWLFPAWFISVDLVVLK